MSSKKRVVIGLDIKIEWTEEQTSLLFEQWIKQFPLRHDGSEQIDNINVIVDEI